MTKPYKCRVEYLESSGTQYIDTGYKLDSKKKISIGFSVSSNQESKVPCGVYDGTNWTYVVYTFGSNGLVTFNNSTQNNLGSFNSGRHDLVVDYKNLTYTYDGTSSTLTGTTRDYTLNLILFGRNNKGTADALFNGLKVYYFKEYDNDVLVRDFIPVLDNSGRPAMYDQVSGQLFYNQGSGEFTYGRQIIPVEYLESTGTQWIDTGSNVNTATDTIKLYYELTETANYKWIFGEYDTNARIGLGSGDGTNLRNFLYQQTATKVSDTKMYGKQHLFEINSNGGFLDGTKIRDYASFASTSTIYLFNLNIDSTSDYRCKAKIWGYEQKRNNILILDLIPAIDENNTPFMFDKVHNTVYLNAGTGQFKVGPYKSEKSNKKLLRKKLALMLANLKKKRKYYCEVEYLESTGTQYIDTGITGNNNTKIDVLFSKKNTSANFINGIVGARGASVNENNIVVGINNAQIAIDFVNGGSGSYATYRYIATDTLADIKYRAIASKTERSLYQGNTLVGQNTTLSNQTINTTNLRMFGVQNYGFTESKIYYCKIYDNDVLVGDFIPVLDWDMTPCMYDRVTEQLFYNAGTGDFSYGREIHYVDYLESTGTQYIDTGIKLTNNHSVELDYQLTQASQSRAGLYGNLATARYGTLLSPSNQYLEFGYGTSNLWYQMGLPDTNRHVIKQVKNNIYLDGSLLTSFTYSTFSIANTAPLGSFGYTNYTPAKAKYYGSRWWDNDTLVRDYKPAIDENGVCFWFDRVTHTIYDNAGTDAFKYPARETEYTGNNGTAAYIDLGAKYKPSMSIEGKYTRDTSGSQGSVILVTTTTTAPLIYLPALSGTTTERFVWRRGGYTEQSFFINNITYPYTTEMVVDAVNDTLTLNGNVVKTGMIAGMNGYNSPYESSSNMYMFSIAGTYAGDGKVYYLKITDGTTPVFDLMPAYKDGDAGFYNKVTGVFFKNASTNTSTYLVAGKIVEPEYE